MGNEYLNWDPNAQLNGTLAKTPAIGSDVASGSSMYTGNKLGADIPNFMRTGVSDDTTLAYQMQNPGGVGVNNIDLNTVGTGNEMNWGMQGYGGLALGAGQLGLGVMSYLDNQKTADAQRKILGQQADNNEYIAAKNKRNDAGLKAAFRPTV